MTRGGGGGANEAGVYYCIRVPAPQGVRIREEPPTMAPMAGIFKKLNLKGQSEIVVPGAPASFEPELAALKDVPIRRSLAGVRSIHFPLTFVTRKRAPGRALTRPGRKRTSG